jgi:hypothetical protein
MTSRAAGEPAVFDSARLKAMEGRGATLRQTSVSSGFWSRVGATGSRPRQAGLSNYGPIRYQASNCSTAPAWRLTMPTPDASHSEKVVTVVSRSRISSVKSRR